MEGNIRCRAGKNGVGGIRSDRVIGRLVICRDNDNGTLHPTSINVCDERADNLNLGERRKPSSQTKRILKVTILSAKLFLTDKTDICARPDLKLIVIVRSIPDVFRWR